MSRMARAKLAAEIGLAVEELGRRTMLGLACPCRRSVVGSGGISNRIVDQVKEEFAPVDVMEFVRSRAVRVWTAEKEAAPRFLRLAAGAVAFRRSLVCTELGKELDAGRLLKMVLASAVDVWIGDARSDAVCRMVEEVTAYRRFVSRMPEWVVREMADSISGLSLDDESDDLGSDEELEASFSGSSGEECEEADVGCGASGTYSQTLYDCMPEKEELTDHLDECGSLVNLTSPGILDVNQPTAEIMMCNLNTFLENYDTYMDSSVEDAGDVPEGESASSLFTFLGDHSEANLRESGVPSNYSGMVLEFENSQESSASIPGLCKTKENTQFLEETIRKLHIVASDPCRCMMKSYKNSYEILLQFRMLLFLDTHATESTGVVPVSHVPATNNMLSIDGELPHFVAGVRRSCEDDGHISGSDGVEASPRAKDEVALCKATTSISTYPCLMSKGHQIHTVESDQAFQYGVLSEIHESSLTKTKALQYDSASVSQNNILVSENEIYYDAGSHEVEGREMLENIHFLAVDLFYLGSRNLKSIRRRLMRFRRSAFLNVSVVLDVKRRLRTGNEGVLVKKLQGETIQETSHAEMDKMHDNTVVKQTCRTSDIPSKVTAATVQIEYNRRHVRDKEPADVQTKPDINVPAETSGHACGSYNLKPAPDFSGASVFDAASLKESTNDETATSGNIAMPEAMFLKPGIDLNATCKEEITNVCPNAVYDIRVGVNSVASSFDNFISVDNLSLRTDSRSRMANGRRSIPSPHSLKRSPAKKRRVEHISLYQTKLQKSQSKVSLRQFYASPLMAETSKPALKVKSNHRERGTDLCKILHMKFPKDFKLPSKEELEKKFRVFGRLDRTRTKIFYYTGAAEIVFLKAEDAQAAFTYARRKRVFTHVDVRFWFDKHERFRIGYKSAAMSAAAGDYSLKLKSCLKKPDMLKEEDQRKDQRVKFSVNFSSPQITANKDSAHESIPQDDIPGEVDISGRMLRLLVRCDEVVDAIKRDLGLDSYYSIFVHAYDLRGALELDDV